jgi:Ca2+ transporting ATPase
MNQNMHGKLHPATQKVQDQQNQHHGFFVTANDLSMFCSERTHLSFAELLKIYLRSRTSTTPNNESDVVDSESFDLESPDATALELQSIIQSLESEKNPDIVDGAADMATMLLVKKILQTSTDKGISNTKEEVENRRAVFGTNAIPEKKMTSFLALCFEAVQDFVLIMLIVMGVLEIVIESTVKENGKKSKTGWIEGVAILVSVTIVVLVSATLDYAKQFAFKRLTKSLDDSNVKVVIRNGEKVNVTDADIVVGDILLVNSHNLANIPADCVLLSPSGELKMDESSLTGESKLISKKPGDVILSGTNAVEGTGKMVVVAVGFNSVSGKIKARVYESSASDKDELGGEGEESPLFTKLTTLAKRIGIIGTTAAVSVFVVSSCVGLIANNEPTTRLIHYLVLAITVLAVAVPEGLPLAVTLALAYSSNKMMKEQNLVKHLDACETMGCATTICTDKTGRFHPPYNFIRLLFTY